MVGLLRRDCILQHLPWLKPYYVLLFRFLFYHRVKVNDARKKCEFVNAFIKVNSPQ